MAFSFFCRRYTGVELVSDVYTIDDIRAGLENRRINNIIFLPLSKLSLPLIDNGAVLIFGGAAGQF